jgi:hypothetical protein
MLKNWGIRMGIKEKYKLVFRGGPGQKISVGLKVLYTIGFFFYFDNSVKQQTMHEITTNTTSLAKKEQRQTNKQENFYSKRETNKPNLKNHKIFIRKKKDLLNIY